MGKKELLKAILKLPEAERLELLDEVHSQTHGEAEFEESPEFLADLDRRYKAWLKDPSRGKPWAEVQKDMVALLQTLRANRGELNGTKSRKRPSRRTK